MGWHFDRSQPDHFSETYFTQSQSAHCAHLSEFLQPFPTQVCALLYSRNFGFVSLMPLIYFSIFLFCIQVTFQPKSGDPGHSHIEGEAETLQKPGIPGVDPGLVTIQCFPFYSVLLAVGQTRIDFFSLDVEGHELEILKTIPWHKVDIKVRDFFIFIHIPKNSK